MTVTEFVARHGVKMSVHRAVSNPHMQDDAWTLGATHWKVGLTKANRRMILYWSQGSAIRHEPKIADVLDALASDASGIEGARDFADWASGYGYDVDSRKAEKTYRTVTRQAAALRRVLGDDAFGELLACERE